MDRLDVISRAAGPDGALYTGILDENLKREFSSEFVGVIVGFQLSSSSNRSTDESQLLLKNVMRRFNRIGLDSENAAQACSAALHRMCNRRMSFRKTSYRDPVARIK